MLAEDGVARCAPLPSPNLVPFGRVAARERQGSAVAESLVVLYRVGTHQIRRARGGLNLCAREPQVRTGRFLREKLMFDHGHFSSNEGLKERRTGKICGLFQ